MRPLVSLVIAFIFGLITSRLLEPDYPIVILLLLISTALLTSATIKGGKVRTVLALPAFFALGLLYLLPTLTLYDSPDNIRNIIKADLHESRPKSMRLEGRIRGALEQRAGGVRFFIDLTGVDAGGGWQTATGRVQVTSRDRKGVAGELQRGDLVRGFLRLKLAKNFGNEGGFDYQWWLRGKGISATAYLRAGRIVKIEDGAASFLRVMDAYRAAIAAFIDRADLKHAGILKALTIGEKGTITEHEKEIFRSSGTAHLLAISGLHVGFVAFISYLFILWLLKRSSRLMLAIDVRRSAVMVSFLPVLFYGTISGFSLSTQRAVIMIGAYVITVAICRVRDLYSTLALAAFVVLLLNPASLWDVGFQLSFTAVLVIIYFISFSRQIGSGVLNKDIGPYLIRRLLLRFKDFTLVTVAASLATIPIMALYFHRVSAIGFIANLIIVPIATFIVVPLGLLSVLAYPISSALSLWLMQAADLVIGQLVWLAGGFSQAGWAFSWVATPSLLEVVAYYLALAALPLFFLRLSRRRASQLLILSLISLVVFYGYAEYSRSNGAVMEVTFISVGQGDATLVEFPEGQGGQRKRMIIDGGGFASTNFDSGKDIIAPLLWKKKIKKIDYLVLSHPQRDHMKGLEFVARNFRVKEFWWGGVGRLSNELKKVLDENRIKVSVLGQVSPAKDINGVRLEFLNPLGTADQLKRLDINDSSLVMRLSYGRRAILFAGDVAEAGEAAVMQNSSRSLGADILKVPHHGSRYSSSGAFIELVAPQAAVMTLGRGNSFGFPHKETLARYEDREIEIFRTDLGGAVIVTTDGEELQIRSYLTD